MTNDDPDQHEETMRLFSPRFLFKAMALLLLSLATMGAGIIMNTRSDKSRYWPSIEGTIVSGQVDQILQSTGRGALTCCWATIVYRYTVGTVTHQNDKISYHGAPCIHGQRGRRLAEEMLARYPVSGSVKIYYDPDNPQLSCLEPGRTNDGVGIILLGAAIFVFFTGYTGGRALDHYAALGDFQR